MIICRGIRTTAQFNSKIFSTTPGKPHQWASDNLKDFHFSKDKQSFKAEHTSMDLSEDGKTYHIKSSVNKHVIVDLKFTQAAPGFVAGKNGTTNYGTEPAKPWGRIRHGFWPVCKVEGIISSKEGPVDFEGRGLYIPAMQGMKPHFAGMLISVLASSGNTDNIQHVVGTLHTSSLPPTPPYKWNSPRRRRMARLSSM